MVLTRSHQPQLLSGRADSNMSLSPLTVSLLSLLSLLSLISLIPPTAATHNYDRSGLSCWTTLLSISHC